MELLLEKQFFVALLCLSMSVTIPATRKEDLERAAELAVERAAERAAERAVEKALEAGNTTSTTITVKESYSNARKTAEEQAAPGSESTRYSNKETAFFESRDVPDFPDYEPSLNGTDYTDYNDSRGYDDEESSGYGDYKDSRDYSDHNDSKGYSDYNESTGYSDYNVSSSFGDFNDSRDFGDYNVSRGFDDFNESKNYEEYNIPRGFGDYNFGGRVHNDSRSFRDPRGYNQFKSLNDFSERNYTDSNKLRISNNNSRGYEDDSKKLKDHDDSKGYEVEEDYSSFLKDIDYKKLNSSKFSTDPEITLPLGDFDWSSNDSDLRHEFGSKLSGVGTKLADSALLEDISFYSTETDFSKKTNSKKEGEGEDDEEKDDSWESYSDLKKEFKIIGDEPFSKDKSFLKEYEPFIKGFWDGDYDKNSRPSSTSYSISLSRNENSRSVNPQYHKRLSRDNAQKRDFREYSNRSKETSDERDSDRSEEEYKEGSYERSKDISNKESKERYRDETTEDCKGRSYERTKEGSKERPREQSRERYLNESSEEYKETSYDKSMERFSDESREEYEDRSYERFKERSNIKPKELLPDESREEYKEKSYDRSKEKFSDESTEEYYDRLLDRPTVKPREGLPDESREEYKEKSYEKTKEGPQKRPKGKSKPLFSDETREEYGGGSYERYNDRPTEKSKIRFPDRSREYKENVYKRYKERPKERRTERTTERTNIRYASNKKEKNASEDVKTVSYKLEPPLFNTNKKMPIDFKESRRPYITYKVQKKIPDPGAVNFPTPVPVKVTVPIHLQENSHEVKEYQENLQGNDQGNLQGLTHVQFLQKLYDSLNLPTNYPYIPRPTLTLQKPIPMEVVDHHHKVQKPYSGQKRLPIQKQQQQVIVDDRLPMLIKMGVPGPFPIESEHLQSEKPYQVPAKIYIKNPDIIHLDKSIPLALKERIPFIIHIPLKPKENQGWSESRYSKKYENVPTDSQSWIKKVSWV